MRASLALTLTLALTLSGCLQSAGTDDLDGLDGPTGHAAERVDVTDRFEDAVSGAWERVYPIQVGAGWRDLVGTLDVEATGGYDLELVAPDGTVRDTCGPTGCSRTTGGSASITHGGAGGADVQHGEWTLRAWGEGVGTIRLGYDAQVPPGTLVPLHREAQHVVGAQWRRTVDVTLPDDAQALHAEVLFTGYNGLWTVRFEAPDGNAFGACKDGCGPTVGNNDSDQITVDAPAAGTWKAVGEGDGAGLVTFRVRALVPAA